MFDTATVNTLDHLGAVNHSCGIIPIFRQASISLNPGSALTGAGMLDVNSLSGLFLYVTLKGVFGGLHLSPLQRLLVSRENGDIHCFQVTRST